jgi:hypothetical protein
MTNTTATTPAAPAAATATTAPAEVQQVASVHEQVIDPHADHAEPKRIIAIAVDASSKLKNAKHVVFCMDILIDLDGLFILIATVHALLLEYSEYAFDWCIQNIVVSCSHFFPHFAMTKSLI